MKKIAQNALWETFCRWTDKAVAKSIKLTDLDYIMGACCDAFHDDAKEPYLRCSDCPLQKYWYACKIEASPYRIADMFCQEPELFMWFIEAATDFTLLLLLLYYSEGGK